MFYCPDNASVFTPWLDRGVAPCFLDTFSSAFFMSLMFTLGISQLVMYYRYGTLIDAALRPKSRLYSLQVLLHVVLLAVPVLTLAIIGYDGKTLGPLHGHQIVKGCSQCLVWTVALMLLTYERNYDLPLAPPRGHGALLLAFWSLEFVLDNLAVVSFNSKLWWFKLHNYEDQVKLGLYAFQYVCMSLIFILGFKAPGLPTMEQRHQFAYRTLHDPESGGRQSGASQGSTFKGLFKKLSHLLPYLWPKGSISLQLRVLICLLLLVVGRVVNLYVPIYHKWIVESLTTSADGPKEVRFRWDLILIYVGLLLAQGGALSGGLLSVIRSFLWIGVQQYSTREVQLHLYKHLHSLSLRWHLSRKTGEVLRVVDRGTNSINNLLSYILFNIGPTVVDIVIAIIYFTSYFNAWFGIIVFVTMVVYLSWTIYFTEWRTKYRRAMNRLDNETEAKAVDSLLNFETVKYYNAEDYEVQRYREALYKYQSAEWLSQATLSLLNFAQNFIITGGLLAGSMLCAYMVASHESNFTVGDYVLFASYIMQLYNPLNWLGTYYKIIQTAFVDMENMFDLLGQEPEVRDQPSALPLIVHEGRIEFNDVCFHYHPERPVLKNVTFVVDPGKTVALVGPSGGGKSTVIRLLFRLYDVQSGKILFDGQDVSAVSQKSLRQRIGVVPQDTVLFNDTIEYNIHYGRVSASEDEVYKAAQAAEIHERILSFPDGYKTVVGERGLKLSGGEKQRVAIARTILKSPDFVLLDEATSALDTHTERLIQGSLNRICVGRTTVIVAHRLSTIIHADEILVLKEGIIVERGRFGPPAWVNFGAEIRIPMFSHDALLQLNGEYAGMWQQQQEKYLNDEASFSGSDRRDGPGDDSVDSNGGRREGLPAINSAALINAGQTVA